MALTAEKTLLVASAGRPTNAAIAAAASLLDPRLPAVELRLDALGEKPDFPALRRAFAGRTLLATLRSRTEGGRFDGTASEAAEVLGAALDAGFDLVDVELALGGIGLLGLPREKVVVSSHDFDRTPPAARLRQIVKKGRAGGAHIVKMACRVRNQKDLLPLFEALREVEAGPLCVIGMGEAGLITRIALPCAGSCLAYGFLDEAAAPGQLSCRELKALLRRFLPASRIAN